MVSLDKAIIQVIHGFRGLTLHCKASAPLSRKYNKASYRTIYKLDRMTDTVDCLHLYPRRLQEARVTSSIDCPSCSRYATILFCNINNKGK